MASNQIILISGANRGIGAGLTKKYLALPSHTVIAAVRDPSNPTSVALSSFPAGQDSKLVFVKYDASASSAKHIVDQLESNGITHIDTVIANAGIATFWGAAVEAPASALQEHYNINTIGSLLLYQATWPLLAKSSNPKFAYIGTTIGSIADMEKYPFQGIAYGTSKAAMNYIVRKIHLENENVTIFSIHPGWVQTEMGNAAGEAHGFGEAAITIDESVNGLTEQINKATREETSGHFLSYDGTSIPW